MCIRDRYGNKLIVAVNSNDSVRKLKGDKRPIIDQYSRALNLECHAYIDAVIIFEEDTPLHLIETIQPHVLIKGGDYTEATIVGAKEVKENSGEVMIIPLLEGFSSTNVIDKILNA